MKKKLLVSVALIMGMVFFFAAKPTEVEATSYPVINNAEVASLTKQSLCLIKGTVKVTNRLVTGPGRAKITVRYNGRNYRDCCAKFLRSVPVLDNKGDKTGEYIHYYTFCGLKVC